MSITPAGTIPAFLLPAQYRQNIYNILIMISFVDIFTLGKQNNRAYAVEAVVKLELTSHRYRAVSTV